MEREMELISKEDALASIGKMFTPLPSQQDLKEDCLEILDNLPVIEKSGEITYEQFREYCEKRCLVVVTAEFYGYVRNFGKSKSKHDEFEKALVDLFAPIMECDINHREYEETVADIIHEVMDVYDKVHPAERKNNG
jgi:hypothetical protein